MTADACQHLHETLSRLPRLRREDLSKVPPNGIYVLFENGEEGHNGERIVRVGTHRGNLAPRASIFIRRTRIAAFSESALAAVYWLKTKPRFLLSGKSISPPRHPAK